MSAAHLIVAHQFLPATSALLAAHPLVGEVRAVDLGDRWAVPTDVDVIFALDKQGENARDVAAPPGWPGRVRFVQIASAGTDGYPRWLLDAPAVATAAGTSAGPISEYVLAVMLAHEKRLAELTLADGDAWPGQDAMLARPLGELGGKTLGLIGIGAIGARVAALGRAFGMRVIAHRRSSAAMPEGVEAASFDDVLSRADHLVLAAPLAPDTAGLIGAAALARVRHGVHIVNIARGGLIDTPALIDALQRGQVGGASLDVTDPEPLPPGHPLWSAPNVRITPHIAWSSAGTPARIFQLFADNLARFAAGEPLLNAL